MPSFHCSLCGYTNSLKTNVIQHISRKVKCGEGNPVLVQKDADSECEYCKKLFATNPSMKRHLKTCKINHINRNKEIMELREKLSIVETFNKDIGTISKKYEELKKINENNEKIIDSIVNKTTTKILGNTPVESIRSQARKKYKEIFKNMKCVHCKHDGSTQVCHIKAISDFDKFSEIEEINKMSNLIGLCPNCHIDLDKHKKFEVTRTAMLHSIFVSLN
jgi:5-methylcytosine-specific restriction endonuclease McrA